MEEVILVIKKLLSKLITVCFSTTLGVVIKRYEFSFVRHCTILKSYDDVFIGLERESVKRIVADSINTSAKLINKLFLFLF